MFKHDIHKGKHMIKKMFKHDIYKDKQMKKIFLHDINTKIRKHDHNNIKHGM